MRNAGLRFEFTLFTVGLTFAQTEEDAICRDENADNYGRAKPCFEKPILTCCDTGATNGNDCGACRTIPRGSMRATEIGRARDRKRSLH